MIAPWLANPLRANARAYGEVALAAALINVIGLSTSIFSMTVYDHVVPASATNSLIALSLGMVLLLAFDFTLRTLRGAMIDHAGARVDRTVGEAIFERVLALPLGQRRGSIGAFAATLREYETLRDLLASATLAVLVDVPFALLFLALIALIGGPLVFVAGAMGPVVILAALASQSALARLTAAAVEGANTRQGVLVETLGALETVRSVGAGPLLAARWVDALDGAAAAGLRQRRVAARAANIAGTAQSVAYVGTIAAGVAMVGEGGLSVGAVVACSLLAGRAVAPLGGLANLLVRLAHARAAYRALDRVMSGPVPDPVPVPVPVPAAWGFAPGPAGPPAPGPPAPGPPAPGPAAPARPAAPEIVFENVHFTYPNATAPALSGLSFRIAPGERVAVLGRSGSGKSTLTRLILGLYPVNHGRLEIAPKTHLSFGANPQDPALLTGSLLENLTLHRPTCTPATLARAAQIADLDTLLGPDWSTRTLTDRGESLSGGQRQAVSLARALATDPPLLLLDEPTSAMDSATEAALIARLAPALADRTLLLVTHRAPLLALVDRILVLEAGRLALDGPRDAVLARLRTAEPAPPEIRAAA